MASRTSLLLEPDVLPAFRTHPEFAGSSGREVTELAAAYGLRLDPWQADVLHVALGEGADGRWAARDVGLVVPRQNGKGAVLEALILAALLLFDEKLVLYSAHEFKTAQEMFLRVKALFESSPELMARVKQIHNAHGAEGIELKSGHRLRFVARTKGSGRGFTPQRIILDEALNLSPRSVSALSFSISAQDNPQVWFVSSHPERTSEGEFLRGLMRRGRVGDSTLAYVDFCAPDDCDPHDEGSWRAANPGFPHRIGRETIRAELNRVDMADFLRERLGVVDLTEQVADRIVPQDLWASGGDVDRVPEGPVCWAIDASPDLKSAAICVSDGTAGRVVEHHPGVGWLPDVLAGLLSERPGPVRLDPKGPISALLVDLDEREIEWDKVSPQEHSQACGGLLAAVLSGAGALHGDQPVLNAAVDGATRRPYGDAWAWNRRTSSVDISPLVAFTLARWGALQQPSSAPSDFFTI